MASRASSLWHHSKSGLSFLGGLGGDSHSFDDATQKHASVVSRT
eukprot:CAMPEP_0181356962 /NCGR_PEP_ID=MMETSP1106-20121128/4700_1 /TAXON_ID=81844 /ORGANISM="Mantoniella antarctica, Strain SL-175" /LENGTH=43 /DNA_ID= /DNA_START= /DNA_END= /DNA_ORIENTATION=